MRYLLSVLALLFWFNTASAETTCTTNDLGDRTCTTVTQGTNIPGTTTGNILENSTFGTGSTTSTTGWSTDGDHGVHTHGNFGNFPYQSGMDTSGGVLAFQGHEEDNVYQDVDLVGDGHLTQSQINEGFTSTMSADVWFWNSVQNTLTIKQTITTPDGTVTTQVRTINDTNAGRPTNGGTFTNYTNVYTHNSNTETDFTIRAELYNVTAGTAYDSMHMGPDVDNVELSITTAGEQSSTFTPCQDLGTCTSAGEDIQDAVNLTTDDGVDLFQDLDTKVEDAVKDFEEVKIVSVDTKIEIKDDLGEFEEVKFEEFVEMQFTSFIEENNLVEDFKEELKVEGISEEQFFEELGNEMMEEIGEEMMTEITELNEPEMEEPKMEETNEEVIEEKPTEEVIEEKPTNTKTEEEPNATSNENESTTETSTTEETLETNEETESTGQKDEDVSTESEVAEDTEAEGQTETEDSAETVEGETDVDVKDESIKSDISKKVARIIKKLEAKLKRVDDKIKATSYVLAVTLQNLQPDMNSYINKSMPKGPNLVGVPNDDFFDNINRIAQQQIYKDASLNAYTSNDPIAVQTRLLNEIENKKNQLKAEIAALRSIN